MRIVDVLLALPGILFAMALIAVLGRSQAAALVAVGVTGIPSFARVTRAQVLSLRKRDFVTAVEAFGGTPTYNMFRTVLPNVVEPDLRAGGGARPRSRSCSRRRWRFSASAFRRRRRAGARCCAPARSFLYEAPYLRRAARHRADADDPVVRHDRPQRSPACSRTGTRSSASSRSRRRKP